MSYVWNNWHMNVESQLSYFVSYIVGLTALRLGFFMRFEQYKVMQRFYIEFRQNFTKETFSYDEHLKS